MVLQRGEGALQQVRVEEALSREGLEERERQNEGTAHFSFSPNLVGGKMYYLLTRVQICIFCQAKKWGKLH